MRKDGARRGLDRDDAGAAHFGQPRDCFRGARHNGGTGHADHNLVVGDEGRKEPARARAANAAKSARGLSAPRGAYEKQSSRTDDDRGAMPDQRRQLVAERLARTGRHHRQRVIAGQRAFDHRLLHAAKMGKAETVVEKLMHAGHSRTIAAARPTRKLAR